jgi:hypothetical protein
MTGVWQPIETAPKDSTAILLWPYTPGDIWSGHAPKEVALGYYVADGVWLNPEDAFGTTFEPTHWMPLPEPPEEKL